MLYNSVRDHVWEQLVTNRPRRKDAPTREEFLRVCTAFYQAENCPSTEVAIEIRLYRAEYNIWAYFFGENSGFAGKDPASPFSRPTTPATATSYNKHFEPSQTTQPTSSISPRKHKESELPHKITAPDSPSEMRELLEERWRTRSGWQDFKPQLGWDPATGTPWMSIYAYSEDAYPAMTGSHHRYMKSFEKKIPKFHVRYERFLGCLVIWLEFKEPEDTEKPEVWEEYNMLRYFLVLWAEERKSRPVYKAYNEFLKLEMEERESLPFPEGSLLEKSRGFCEAMVTGGKERGCKEQMSRIKDIAREKPNTEEAWGRRRVPGGDDVQYRRRDRSRGGYRENRRRRRSSSPEGNHHRYPENRREGGRRLRGRSPREVDSYHPRY